MYRNLTLWLTLLGAILLIPAGDAVSRDLHLLWEDRCGDCHGHAGEFARDHLIASDGVLQGRHHTDDLRQFMTNHYAVATEINAILDMLYAQASTPPRFKDECSECHDLAAKFVRTRLELRDGILYSRNTGQSVQDFLESHRNLVASDIEFFTRHLTRIANEVYRP